MTLKTCAACDCELDAHPIEVTIGGHTVEVCCADCARALNEAAAAREAAPHPASAAHQASVPPARRETPALPPPAEDASGQA